MGNRIEKTTTIEIAGLPVIFYKMANADIFIDTQNVDNVFGSPLDPKIPFVTLYNASIKNDVLAYPIDIIVDNLSEDRLRYFAKTGIVNLLDNSLLDKKNIEEQKETTESTAPEQPELSDFDKLLKRALDYNPKSK